MMGFKNLFRHIVGRKEVKFLSDGNICRVETVKDKLSILIYDTVDPLFSSVALEHEIGRLMAFLRSDIFKGPLEAEKMKECSRAFEPYYQGSFIREMIDILMKEKSLIDKILSAYSFIETGGSEA